MGSYSVQHRGATGGSAGPGKIQPLVGASHRNAGLDGPQRNAYSRVQGGGQAASLPPAVAAVMATDKPHHVDLDGHRDSAIASHPDGLFARNTAATSSHSIHANYETFRSVFTGFDDTHYDEGEGPAQAHLGATHGVSNRVSVGTLMTSRKERLFDQPELVVKDAAPGPSRVMSVLSRDYSGQELAMGAIGLYAAYSVIAQA